MASSQLFLMLSEDLAAAHNRLLQAYTDNRTLRHRLYQMHKLVMGHFMQMGRKALQRLEADIHQCLNTVHLSSSALQGTGAKIMTSRGMVEHGITLDKMWPQPSLN